MKQSLGWTQSLGMLLVAVMVFSVPAFAQFGGGGFQRPEFVFRILEVDPVSTDETITIQNGTRSSQDMTGWTIVIGRPGSNAKSTYTFPAGCVMASGAVVHIHSGPANISQKDQSCDQAEFDLIWSESFLLPNDVVVVELKNADGEVVATFEYPEPIVPAVFINEIEINPEAGSEWVELYNASEEAVDMTGWVLNVQRGATVKLSIPIDRVIGPGEYLIISVPIEFLNDSGDAVEIRTAEDVLVDATPEPGLADTLSDNRCWARAGDGADAWAFQTCTRSESNRD